MKKLSIVLITALMIAGLVISGVAQAGNQVLLGERHVSDQTEIDTINVGKTHGMFTRLRIKVTGARVEFKRIVIHFENGEKQVIERNRILGTGNKSRLIDLEGKARFINSVVFTYEARTRGLKGAKMKLFGVR